MLNKKLNLCIDKRLERMEKAKQFFKADILKNDYIVIPVNRRYYATAFNICQSISGYEIMYK